jgi:hypothetical protein
MLWMIFLKEKNFFLSKTLLHDLAPVGLLPYQGVRSEGGGGAGGDSGGAGAVQGSGCHRRAG